MTALYIILGVLAFIAAVWLFLTAPALRRPAAVRQCMNRPYAHRGLYDPEAGIPENSLEAFDRAASIGYGIELDVHLTADGRLVVMHDENIRRMTGLDTNIYERSADFLTDCRLSGTEHRIPLLSQVLETVGGRVPLLIELKSRPETRALLCERVCAMLDGYSGPFLLESFDPYVLAWLRSNRPELPRGQLAIYYNRHGDNIPPALDFLLHNLLSNVITRPHFVALCHDDRNAFSFSLCRFLFRVPEFVWTVRTYERQYECERHCATVIFERYLPPTRYDE